MGHENLYVVCRIARARLTGGRLAGRRRPGIAGQNGIAKAHDDTSRSATMISPFEDGQLDPIAMAKELNASNDHLKPSATSSQPSLATCSSVELARWLLRHRFAENKLALTTFLLEAVSSIPNAQDISDQLCNEPDDNTSLELGSRLPSDASPTLSLTNPRGKFVAEWFEHGLQLVDSKNNGMHIKSQTIQNLVLFPKPEDLRAKHSKTLTEFALVVFRSNATCLYKDKLQRQLCIQLPAESGSFVNNLCSRLKVAPEEVVRVSESPFRSHQETDTSTTTEGLPCVPCYHGVHDGVLFPLPSGLLFYKPPLFIARQDIHSIACGGRSGGEVSGRYVDLIVETTNDASLEFSNIHRAEGSGLNRYIQSLVNDEGDDENAMGTKASEAKASACEAESRVPQNKRGRAPRKAALAARAACRNHDDADASDDDEVDEDFVVALVPNGEQVGEDTEDEDSVSSASANDSSRENEETESEAVDTEEENEELGPKNKIRRHG